MLDQHEYFTKKRVDWLVSTFPADVDQAVSAISCEMNVSQQ